MKVLHVSSSTNPQLHNIPPADADKPDAHNVEIALAGYVRQLTKVLCGCALRVMSLQSQFSYGISLLHPAWDALWTIQALPPFAFGLGWFVSMVLWLSRGYREMKKWIEDDKQQGDFRKDEKESWSLQVCLFFLCLMSIESDIKKMPLLLHPSRMYTDVFAIEEALPDRDHLSARHRSWVVRVPAKIQHDFAMKETLAVHAPLDCISAMMAVANFANLIMEWSWSGAISLCLTMLSLVFVVSDHCAFWALRAEYKEHLETTYKASRDLDVKEALKDKYEIVFGTDISLEEGPPQDPPPLDRPHLGRTNHLQNDLGSPFLDDP